MKDILDLVAFSNLFIFSVSTSAVFLSFAPFGILDLHTEFSNSAISLDLGRVSADNFDNPSCKSLLGLVLGPAHTPQRRWPPRSQQPTSGAWSALQSLR
jgi:hypothetical protein